MRKRAIEEFRRRAPILLQKKPDVLAITGIIHSVRDQRHSWHPVPVLLTSPWSGSDKLDRSPKPERTWDRLRVRIKILIRLMQPTLAVRQIRRVKFLRRARQKLLLASAPMSSLRRASTPYFFHGQGAQVVDPASRATFGKSEANGAVAFFFRGCERCLA